MTYPFMDSVFFFAQSFLFCSDMDEWVVRHRWFSPFSLHLNSRLYAIDSALVSSLASVVISNAKAICEIFSILKASVKFELMQIQIIWTLHHWIIEWYGIIGMVLNTSIHTFIYSYMHSEVILCEQQTYRCTCTGLLAWNEN